MLVLAYLNYNRRINILRWFCSIQPSIITGCGRTWKRLVNLKVMSKKSLIKVALVADHSIFRTALRMLIEKENKIKIVGEVAKISEVPALIGKEKPDVILLDLSDDNRNDLFSFSIGLLSKTPLMVLTSCGDIETHQKCLRYGVAGLVLKEKSADILYKAIEKVCDGELWFDRSVMSSTIEKLVKEKQYLYENPKSGNAQETITEREKQVVMLICKGLKNKDIAEKLFITETTVRHHLTSIFEKLKITSRLELVIYAFKHNLVKIPTLADTAGNGAGSNVSV